LKHDSTPYKIENAANGKVTALFTTKLHLIALYQQIKDCQTLKQVGFQ
jgi:hypothetical protein